MFINCPIVCPGPVRTHLAASEGAGAAVVDAAQAADMAAQSVSDTDPMARISAKRVLVVEDEILVAMDLEQVLTDAGAEVLGPTMNVPTSMDLLGSGADIDAAVLDINLGKENVFPVATALETKGIPFVFHTAYDDHQTVLEDFPTAHVCSKTGSVDMLLRALAKLL